MLKQHVHPLVWVCSIHMKVDFSENSLPRGWGGVAVKCSGPTTRYLGLKSLYARVGIICDGDPLLRCSICRAVLSLSQKRKLAEKFKNLKKNSKFLEETPNFKKNSNFGTKRLFWWPSQLRKIFFFGLDRCWNNMSTLWSGFVRGIWKSILVKIPSHVGEGGVAVKGSGPTTRYLGLKSNTQEWE